MSTNEQRKIKVAVFVNGWNAENVTRFLNGLSDHSPEGSVDYFVFVCHSIYSNTPTELRSRSAIFDLPDLSTFDAAIMFTPGLNFTETINHLIVTLERAGIPVISIGLQHPGFHSIGVDNYVGMAELCEHIIEKHGVKTVSFIAGSRENEDSNTRIRAVRDTMAKHGLTLADEDIFYSNWEIYPVVTEFSNRLRDGGPLPDAYICANDQLAQMISYVITDCGYDVNASIVTGFDMMESGQNFYPSIATVDQCYESVGEATVGVLMKIVNGEEVPATKLVPCEFRPGESCGCLDCRNDDGRRRAISRTLPRKSMMTDNMDGRFHAMEKEIIQSVDYDDLKDRLRKLFYYTTGMENGNLYIMLDPRIVDFSLTDIASYPQFSYSEKMDTFVAIRNRTPVEADIIPTSELIPGYKPTGKNHFYFFVPTYFESYVCGYIVVPDQISWFRDHYLFNLESRFSRSLVSYRRNVQLTALNEKLSMLMEKDSLTFVKNRTAYDRYVRRLDESITADNAEPFAVVCFDINDLKPVNDQLGHEAGDEYIKNCCKYICNIFKHSPVFRIGGDEFVALAVHDDYTNREQLLTTLREHMAYINDHREDYLPIERLSVASGMSDYGEHIGDDYAAVFRRADERMYQNKRQMKALIRK